MRRFFRPAWAIIFLKGGMAVTVVYLDRVLLLNLLVDYLLLLTTARLAGIPLRRGRLALCAAVGALYAGAEDMKVDDDAYAIYTAPNDFSTVREALEKQGVTFLTAEVDKIPQNTVALPDEETIQKIQKLLEMLEDNDDVQNVYHNAELPEEEDDED